MELHDVWFVLIAVLWTGYFFLEGFDFGIGVLTKLLARDRKEKRVLINTIGPVWDGNEVWLLSAGGATFAAFPEWYATLFSGFYLPLLLILLCLIVRGVAFEYRVKRTGERWQANWEHAIFWTSLLPAFLWGVAFGNIVRGVKIDADMEYVGTLADLLNPYALLGGLLTLTLFTFHGAVFAGLKTLGEIRERARGLALKLGVATGVLAVAFLGWTQRDNGGTASLVAMAVAVLALVAAIGFTAAGREGWAFGLSGVTIVAAVAMLFLTLFPNVMPSSLNDAWSLTVTNASSTPYTLKIMTWCAGIAMPV
ncbi:cytochrome d ubiquinol oxidase subunit II, partial [Streptomyces chryseus]